MVNTFVNPVVSSEAKLGVSLFDETDPVRLLPGYSVSDVERAIRAVYRQVLGNAHVMESERLLVAESQLKRGDISVREFVRRVAQSDLYRVLFFETCPRIRSIELNFKHLLGRAPETTEEIAEHSRYLDQKGFTAEIDSYLDSDEYLDAFGDDMVPYYRGYRTQAGKTIVGFTHLFQLLRGAPSSDKDLAHRNRARVNASLLANRPSAIAPVRGAPFPWHRPTARSYPPSRSTLQSQAPVSIGTIAPPTQFAPDAALQQTIQAQAEEIQKLQQTLADLRPFAAIGAAQLKSGWQPSVAASAEASSALLQQQADMQSTQIAALKDQIADARRYAAIGEARLNKWRSRTFNG